MARGSRLAVRAGLVALCAALATVVFAVLLPGHQAGADRREHGRCAAPNTHAQGAAHGKAHGSSCGLQADQGGDRASGAGPTTRAAVPPTPASTRPELASVPAARTTLTLGPASTSQHHRPAPTSHGTSRSPAAPRVLAADAEPSPGTGDRTSLPGTLVAFALGVAVVVLAAGYRKRGALLVAVRRPGDGRHRPSARHRR